MNSFNSLGFLIEKVTRSVTYVDAQKFWHIHACKNRQE